MGEPELARSATPMPPGGKQVLKALSHPARRQMLRTLEARGHGRATDLAAEVGMTPNLASFHLRTLAAARLVEEAPELRRDARDRVWRPTRITMSIDKDVAREDRAMAVQATILSIAEPQALLTRMAEQTEAYYRGDPDVAKAFLVTLTATGTEADMERLRGDVAALVSEISENADPGDPEVKSWSMYLVAGEESALSWQSEGAESPGSD